MTLRDGRRWPTGARVMAPVLVVFGVTGCASLWQQVTTTLPATPHDAFACAAAQAKELGYRVAPDATHNEIQAERVLPLSAMGPDVNEYTRKDVLAIAVHPAPSGGESSVVVRAETISVQQTRRGMTDVAVPASGAVRQDADSLVAHCQHAAPNTSLP